MKLFWTAIVFMVLVAGLLVFKQSGRAGAPVPNAPPPIQSAAPEEQRAIERPEPNADAVEHPEPSTDAVERPEPIADAIERPEPIAGIDQRQAHRDSEDVPEPNVHEAALLGWAREIEETPVFEDSQPRLSRSGAVNERIDEKSATLAQNALVKAAQSAADLDAALGIDAEDLVGPAAPIARPLRPTTDRISTQETSTNSDGKFALNDRFTLAGSGSEEDPFILAWDVLLSAQEDYRPRQGKKDLPEWVARLEGKYVQLSGFLAVPMMADEAQEILLMRNEWDGCCIGIPPTPYDSVEVKLTKTSSLARHMINFGAVKGRIRIDPYLWKDWLISLYRFEDAVIADTGF